MSLAERAPAEATRIPRPEYPRPDFDRSERWLCLNGEWDFAADPDDVGVGAGWATDGRAPWGAQIVVPFPWEWALSGVGREWLPCGWYRRHVEVPADWADERVILNIGAAHYRTTVWVNGAQVGEHVGGYLPFAFDVTDHLDQGSGELVIRVEAPLDKRTLPHGKQRSRPADGYDGCAFTACSGIWQTVWLEPRPATYIESIVMRPGADLASFDVKIAGAGPAVAGATLRLELDGEAPIAVVADDSGCAECTVRVTSPILWSPETPHLYQLRATLESSDGVDIAKTYSGLRSIAVVGNTIELNGERLYVRGVLDQGYWPNGGHTAPTDDDLKADIELARRAGYNLIRKHIKLEDPRWLYWADRLGMLVWAEPPCAGQFTEEAVERFEAQLPAMVARDGNHPAIVIWGIYNEEWGLDWLTSEDPARQAAVEHAYDLLASCDSTRPIVDDSGWWHVKTDLLDWHYYDEDLASWRRLVSDLARDRSTLFGHKLNEYTWYETGLSVPGRDHAGLPLLNGEYGGGAFVQADRAWHLRWQTQELRAHDAYSGYVYTELTDVEYELCGIYAFDRAEKDFGFDPASVNADTVLILDVLPIEPGLDVLAADGRVELPVRISDHGRSDLEGHLCWNWEGGGEEGRVACAVAPFVCSQPLTVHATLPPGRVSARLELWLEDAAGTRRAHAVLDVGSKPRALGGA
ncbi:MAG: glycoside hydrolase family 2 protein [Gaiellaceae bacterium]